MQNSSTAYRSSPAAAVSRVQSRQQIYWKSSWTLGHVRRVWINSSRRQQRFDTPQRGKAKNTRPGERINPAQLFSVDNAVLTVRPDGQRMYVSEDSHRGGVY